MILEEAKKKDTKFLFNLRNLQSVRKYSNSSMEIEFSEHKKWFHSQLKKKDNLIFIIKYKKLSCGYLRANKIKDNYLISIAVDPIHRKKKLAIKSLICLESKINNDCQFIAEVKKDNKNSIYLFKKAGFDIKRVLIKKIIMKKKIKKISFIDQIEKVRSKNNANWMDILRLAYKKAPNQTLEIMSKIYKSDNEISKLVRSFIKKR